MKRVAVLCVVAAAWSASALDLAVRGRAPEYAIVRAADATNAAIPPKAVFLNMSRLLSQVSCPLNLGKDEILVEEKD